MILFEGNKTMVRKTIYTHELLEPLSYGLTGVFTWRCGLGDWLINTSAKAATDGYVTGRVTGLSSLIS